MSGIIVFSVNQKFVTMKKLIFTFIVCFVAVCTQAQITNSKWKTTLYLDASVDVVFSFGADTLAVIVTDNNESLEIMRYTLQDTVLSITKLYGRSECGSNETGNYSFKITGNEMWLKLISDGCYDRANVIRDLKLTKAD